MFDYNEPVLLRDILPFVMAGIDRKIRRRRSRAQPGSGVASQVQGSQPGSRQPARFKAASQVHGSRPGSRQPARFTVVGHGPSATSSSSAARIWPGNRRLSGGCRGPQNQK